MTCLDVLGIEMGKCARDEETPVSALSYVFVVAKREHQFVACFSVVFYSESLFGDAG